MEIYEESKNCSQHSCDRNASHGGQCILALYLGHLLSEVLFNYPYKNRFPLVCFTDNRSLKNRKIFISPKPSVRNDTDPQKRASRHWWMLVSNKCYSERKFPAFSGFLPPSKYQIVLLGEVVCGVEGSKRRLGRSACCTGGATKIHVEYWYSSIHSWLLAF